MRDVDRYLRGLGLSLLAHAALLATALWLWSRPPQESRSVSVLWEVDLSTPIRKEPAVVDPPPAPPDLASEPPVAAALSEPSLSPPEPATGTAPGPIGSFSAAGVTASDLTKLFQPAAGTVAFPMAGVPGASLPPPATYAGPGGGLAHSSADPLGLPLAAIVRIPPAYPIEARRKKIEGWARMEFTVLEDGTVTDIKVKAAEPAGVFEQAATAAIARWKFQPAVENGRPVRKRAAQTLRFELNR